MNPFRKWVLITKETESVFHIKKKGLLEINRLISEKYVFKRKSVGLVRVVLGQYGSWQYNCNFIVIVYSSYH